MPSIWKTLIEPPDREMSLLVQRNPETCEQEDAQIGTTADTVIIEPTDRVC